MFSTDMSKTLETLGRKEQGRKKKKKKDRKRTMCNFVKCPLLEVVTERVYQPKLPAIAFSAAVHIFIDLMLLTMRNVAVRTHPHYTGKDEHILLSAQISSSTQQLMCNCLLLE